MTPKPPARRGRRPLPGAARKDRLVQTRVPENLEETLREQARRKRVSVSQLIRNVLEDAFDLVDNVVAEAQSMGRTVSRDARRIAASAKGRATAGGAGTNPPGALAPAQRQAHALAAVDAWQEVVLNRDVGCASCGRKLRKGAQGFYGLQADPAAPRIWLCPACAVAS